MGWDRRRTAALALALVASACGPKLDGLEQGEKGLVAEVRDGDTLVLKDGLVVHLAGIETPRTNAPHAREARAALEKHVLHRSVQLGYGGERRARDAAVAHVFAQTEGGRWVWVQQAMLLAGDARVRTRPEQQSRLEEMRAAEASARTLKRGLWADPAYAVKPAESLARSESDITSDPACAAEIAALEADRTARTTPAAAPAPASTAATAADGDAAAEERPRRPRRQRDYAIVEGRVTGVAERERAVFLNFGDDISRDFGAILPRDSLEAWPGGLEAVKALEGRNVRIRGEIPLCAKPLMRIDHAAQLEVLK